jgi:DNA-binding MarR family transcriptional regulator
MTREDLFKYIQEIKDPKKDYGKILTTLHFSHYYLMDKYKKILQEYNLTLTQSNILGIIIHHYPKTVSLEQIKEMVLEPNSDVSRTVVRLTEKGYVEKVVNKDNRRKVSIQATSKGVKIAKKIEDDGKFLEFTKEFSLSDAKTLIKLLKKLRDVNF